MNDTIWFGFDGQYSIVVCAEGWRAETPRNARTFTNEDKAYAAVNSDLEWANAPVRFKKNGTEVPANPIGWWM